MREVDVSRLQLVRFPTAKKAGIGGLVPVAYGDLFGWVFTL